MGPTRSKCNHCMASGCHLQVIAVVLTKTMEGAESGRHAPTQRSLTRLWTPSACIYLEGAAPQAHHDSKLDAKRCMSEVQSCQDTRLRTAIAHACTGFHRPPSTAIASFPAGLCQQGSKATRHLIRQKPRARIFKGAAVHFGKSGKSGRAKCMLVAGG
jgi:hypothetical protein